MQLAHMDQRWEADVWPNSWRSHWSRHCFHISLAYVNHLPERRPQEEMFWFLYHFRPLGVELGLLLDVAWIHGVNVIAQSDLGEPRHRKKPLNKLILGRRPDRCSAGALRDP